MTQPINAAPTLAVADAPPPEAVDATGVDTKSTAGSKALAVGAGAAAAVTPKPSEPAPVYAAPSATRLLVEQGTGGQAFVYKLVARATGQVLSEFPREAAKSLAEQASYRAGAIIDESA